MELLLLWHSTITFKALSRVSNGPGVKKLVCFVSLKIDPPICINFSSFLDESICSVPDLEELPNPDMTEIPSFLGQNYETRDCGRVLRSHKKSMSTYHPFSM